MNKVTIKKGDDILYQGSLLDIPIKKDFIVKQSIEIFDDDDPCIIHQSYVVKLFVDDLLKLTELKDKKEVRLDKFKSELSYLDMDLDDCIISYEG